MGVIEIFKYRNTILDIEMIDEKCDSSSICSAWPEYMPIRVEKWIHSARIAATNEVKKLAVDRSWRCDWECEDHGGNVEGISWEKDALIVSFCNFLESVPWWQWEQVISADWPTVHQNKINELQTLPWTHSGHLFMPGRRIIFQNLADDMIAESNTCEAWDELFTRPDFHYKEYHRQYDWQIRVSESCVINALDSMDNDIEFTVPDGHFEKDWYPWGWRVGEPNENSTIGKIYHDKSWFDKSHLY